MKKHFVLLIFSIIINFVWMPFAKNGIALWIPLSCYATGALAFLMFLYFERKNPY